MAQENYNFEDIYNRIEKLKKIILEQIIPFDTYVTHARNTQKWKENPKAYKELCEKHPNTFPETLRNDNYAQSNYITSDETKCENWPANHTLKNKNLIAGTGPFSSHKDYLKQNYFNYESSLLSDFLTAENITLIASLGIGRRSQFKEKEDFSDFYHYWHSSNFSLDYPIKVAQVFVKNGEAIFFDYPSILNFEDLYQEIKHMPENEKTMAHCMAGVGRTGTFLYLYFQRLQLENPDVFSDYENFLFGEEKFTDAALLQKLFKEDLSTDHPKWQSTNPDFRLAKMSMDILRELRISRPAIEGEDQFAYAMIMLVSFYFISKKDYQGLEGWHNYLDSIQESKNQDNPTFHTPIDIFECLPQGLSTITPLSAKLELQKIDLLITLLPLVEQPADNNNTPTATYNDKILLDFTQLYLAFPNTLNSSDALWEKTDTSKIKNLLDSFEVTFASLPTDDFHERDYYILGLTKHYLDRFRIRLDMITKYQNNNEQKISTLFFSSKTSALATLIESCKKTFTPSTKEKNNTNNFERISLTAKRILKIIDFYFASHVDCGKFYCTYDFSLTDYHALESQENPENMIELFSFNPNSTKLGYFDYFKSLKSLYYLLLSVDNHNFSFNLKTINELIQNSLKILQKYRTEEYPADSQIISEIESLCDKFDQAVRAEIFLQSEVKTQPPTVNTTTATSDESFIPGPSKN